MMYKTYCNWSSGKDSTLALYHAMQQQFDVKSLVTSVNAEYDRVSMHGLREALLENQADSLNIPLKKILLPGQVSMKSYSEIMKRATNDLVNEKYTHCIFGDIFLEDLREYRETQLKNIAMVPIFPLWKKNTRKLIEEFITLGFKAITVCVNAKFLDESFCGRIIDANFIKDLPANVDLCGENGEFHTFVFDGPIFKTPVTFEIGEKVLRSYQPSRKKDDVCFTQENDENCWDTSFWYCDLIPV